MVPFLDTLARSRAKKIPEIVANSQNLDTKQLQSKEVLFYVFVTH
jgi:hypothetical protein